MIAKKKVLRSIIILVLVVALGIGGYYITNAIINRPRYSEVTFITFDNNVMLQLGTHAGVPSLDTHYNTLTIIRSQSLIDAIKNSGEIVSSKVDTAKSIESLLLLYEGYFFAVTIGKEIIKISSARIEVDPVETGSTRFI
ncbi:MAG: hypothetical protein LBE09_03190, partial [Christensenellaceae bacterium]|nr:hypothetical protein [Christensenellaceae bacterium]